MASAAWIAPRNGTTTRVEPLVISSPEAMAMPAELVEGPPDPAALLERFEPRGEPFILAARVTGPVSSAFPDGPPEGADKEPARPHLTEPRAPLNLILIGDSDVLADQSWVRRQNVAGQEVVLPVAHNGDFVINALDHLAGSQALLGLRGRGLDVRPFERVAAMEREAALKYRAKEEELLRRIETADANLKKLQREEQQGGVILTAEQQDEIDAFRAEMIQLRQELRLVQRSLREDVEALGFWVRLTNIWAVPALIGLVALGLALWRRLRTSRYPAAA